MREIARWSYWHEMCGYINRSPVVTHCTFTCTEENSVQLYSFRYYLWFSIQSVVFCMKRGFHVGFPYEVQFPCKMSSSVWCVVSYSMSVLSDELQPAACGMESGDTQWADVNECPLKWLAAVVCWSGQFAGPGSGPGTEQSGTATGGRGQTT